MPVELLAPAGSPEALDAAIGEGADAVYLGLKNFNARMRSANFTYSQFESALRSLRRMGKKLYVTVNTVFEQREADRMYQLLKYLSAAGPDALIVADFGVLAMIRSEFPRLKIHASTQMNVSSGRGVNALSRCGVSRVVLGRELGLEELRSVRAETNMELEVFAHGALCVSVSGLCLFSGYLGGKSANRGMCTQACRRLYHRGAASDSVQHPAPEDGYYFSPADLQLLEFLPSLAGAGINALKIEGRMKSADYVGAVVSAYRLVLDAIQDASPSPEGAPSGDSDNEKVRRSIAEGKGVLLGDFARGKTAYYFGRPEDEKISWLNPLQDGGTGISLGVIQKARGRDQRREGLISAPGTGVLPAAGDSVRLQRSDDSERVSHKIKFAEPVTGPDGAAASSCWISIPEGFDKGDRVYLIQTKAMSRRYKPVIAGAASGGRGPGHDKAPVPPPLLSKKAEPGMKPSAGKKAPVLPEGIYVAVSSASDLYIIQSARPARVMLGLNRKNADLLLGKGKDPLPFRPGEIIPVLDPFFPQAESETLARDIQELAALGCRQFVINNLGHLSLFRDIRREVQLIAGPWLYMFNTWALSFIASLGADALVSPLENNRQNLERTMEAAGRQTRITKPMVFVPVFAWPPLFRIRANLGHVYGFSSFSDNRGENFSLSCGSDGSRVFPEEPFSITDKIPFLKEAGFRRFIIDLSGRSLKKSDYRDLMRAVDSGAPLPRISRFNWKNGFFSGEKGAGKSE